MRFAYTSFAYVLHAIVNSVWTRASPLQVNLQIQPNFAPNFACTCSLDRLCQSSHNVCSLLCVFVQRLAWEQQDPEDRKLSFLPQKFACLRAVPAYSRFIHERFERCLDLYLCPRQRKMRVRGLCIWFCTNKLYRQYLEMEMAFPYVTKQNYELQNHQKKTIISTSFFNAKVSCFLSMCETSGSLAAVGK